MVTTIYLVRHGETEGSEVKRYKGSIDVPLSENGIRQIRRTSVFIKEHLKDASPSRHLSYLKDINDSKVGDQKDSDKLKAVYCSPLGRALKSAEIIADTYGLTPIILPDLRERSFGAWENMTFSEIKEKYSDEFAAWASNPLQFSPVGGETTLEVRDRVVRVLEEVIEGLSPTTTNIAIVAHGGVNRVMLCHVMGIPFENVFRIEQDFAAINIIEFRDGYPVVKLVNGGSAG